MSAGQAAEDLHAAAAALEMALLDAHAAGDTAVLAALYAEAAVAAAAAGDGDRAAFFRTHAYVFALEAGHPLAEGLHAALCRDGRDE
ncbi:MAG: hypothetical protein AAF899_12740 [Pseudomonadota bacterium]